MPGLRLAPILLLVGAWAAAGAPGAHDAGGDRSPAERVADVGFRVAVAGLSHCPQPIQTLGLTFQHLDQFEAADRPALLQVRRLDLGPAVLAVARGSPGERAGVLPDDILLTIDGVAAPGPDPIDRPFDQSSARARSDQIDDQLDAAAAGSRPVDLQVLRGDRRLEFAVTPIPSCPSRIHLAQSDQRNAYADGRHVTVTTGLLRKLRSDDELAFVLAHEMAHNILHHAATLRAQGVPRRGLGRMLGKNGQALLATEREADLLGGRLVLDAHYDLYAAAAVLKSIDESFGIAFLSGHDSPGRRIAAVRALVNPSALAVDRPTQQ